MITHDELREIIATMMLENIWHGGHSAKDLATKHGVKVAIVHQRALEASRAIQLAAGGLSNQILRKCHELEGIARIALTRTKMTKDGEVADPDCKSAVAAIRVYAEITGMIGRAAKTAQQVEDEDDEYAKLSPTERVARLEQALEDERARMREGMQ